MPRLPLIAPAIALFLGAAASFAVLAQGVQHISAIVNSDVVSAFDIEQRLQLVLFSSGVPDVPETRRRLREQVIKILVDERLQLQEASRREVRLTSIEIEERIERLAAQVNVSVADFPAYLARQNVRMGTILTRIRAELAWQKLIAGRFARSVRVSKQEIDEALLKIQTDRGKPQHLVSEIFLAVNDPQDEPTIEADAQRLRDEIARGASFEGIAQQFSQSATAAAGGRLGWVQPGQIAPRIEQALLAMEEGDVSDPIRSEGGFYIFRLHDRQRILEVDPADTRVALKQILVDLPAARDEPSLAAARRKAAEITQLIQGCDNFDEIAKAQGDPGSGDLGRLRVGDLPRDLGDVVGALRVGEVSAPILRQSGMHLLIVCERDEPVINIPDAGQIRASIVNNRLALMARRYLRDLRRDAVIEYR